MKEPLVDIAERVAALLVAPLLIVWRAGLISYPTAGQILAPIPGDLGVLIRRAWYSQTLASCGTCLTVEAGSVLQNPDTRIGNHCYFGEMVRVGLADIGDHFMAADGVRLISGMGSYSLSLSRPLREQPLPPARITIGEDVGVCTSAVVGADVADHTIVAAGAVVSKTFGEGLIIAGVPAQPVSARRD